MSIPVQPWQRLLIDLGLPFRIVFERDLSTQEFMELLALDGPKTERIIRRRYGLDGGKVMSQSEVGGLEGLTRARIQQLEAAWLRKARQRLGLRD